MIPTSLIAELSRLVDDESARRKNGISAAAANTTRGTMAAQADNEFRMGDRYSGRAPVESPREDAIRARTMQMSQANGDSTDELRNYALLHRASAGFPGLQRQAPPAPGAPPRAPGYPDINIDAVPNPYRRPTEGPQQGYSPQGALPAHTQAQLAELEAAKQQTLAGIEQSDKAKRMAELDAAGEKAIADMNGIPDTAPGTKSAIAQTLDQRAKEITAAMAAPGPAYPTPQQPVMQPQAAPPPVAPGPPVARFPLIPPPVYPASPVYPVPAPPNVPMLDQAQLAAYARARGGM